MCDRVWVVSGVQYCLLECEYVVVVFVRLPLRHFQLPFGYRHASVICYRPLCREALYDLSVLCVRAGVQKFGHAGERVMLGESRWFSEGALALAAHWGAAWEGVLELCSMLLSRGADVLASSCG